MATVSRSWISFVALLALLAVAGASTLTVFEGPGCTRNLQVYSCGKCEPIKYTGGYYFSKTQGNARLYTSSDCSGWFPEVITDDTWVCSAFNYKSVFISCSSSPWDVTARN